MRYKSHVKEVITAPKRKGDEKMQMIQMIGLMRPMLIKVWNCVHSGNHF